MELKVTRIIDINIAAVYRELRTELQQKYPFMDTNDPSQMEPVIQALLELNQLEKTMYIPKAR